MDLYHDDRMKKVDEMEEIIVESLGDKGALQAICKALSYDAKEEIYSYIIRMNDLIEEEEE